MIRTEGLLAEMRNKLDSVFSLENLPLSLKAMEYCADARN
jgi:hypothetical protein